MSGAILTTGGHGVFTLRRAGRYDRRPIRGGKIMPVSQSEKADRFRALHQGPRAFLIANAWDPGSTRILAGLGFQALATSSGASAGILGKRDGQVTREEALSHARAIVDATDLPV